MHTKDKGDIAEAFVIADLARKGNRVAIPIGENVPFDLIAICPSHALLRLQVKYRSIAENGAVSVKLASIWRNSSVTRSVKYDLSAIDYFAIYCPEIERVAYVPASTLRHNKVFALRVSPSKNRQVKGVRSFDAYADL